MSAIDEVLWNIFTFYSLNGNPRDPSRLHSMALLKMCRDVRVLDHMMADNPITQADLHLIYTSVIKGVTVSKIEGKSDKLNFDDYLACLVRIAEKCYPGQSSSEDSMQQFLMDNILPSAHRREPESINVIMKEPGIESIMRAYETPLMKIFKFFASASDGLTKNRNMVKSTSNIVKTFDDHKDIIQVSKTRRHMESLVANMMCYADFIRFVQDLGLVSTLPITIVEFGDIYLTVTFFNNFTPTLRKLEFKEFCEALVRIALLAFKDVAVSNENKVKGLFLNLWRYMQELLGAHMMEYGTIAGGGFNTYKEELLNSVEAFSSKFKTIWAKDEYRNYVDPKESQAEEEQGVMASLNAEHEKNLAYWNPASRISSNKSVSASGSAPLLSRAAAQRKGKHGGNISSKHSTRSPSKAAAGGGGGGGGKSVSPSPSSSLLSKLKGGGGAGGLGGGDYSDTASVRSGRSAGTSRSGATGTVAETISELRSVQERLLSTLHDNVEEQDNFVIKASDDGLFRVLVDDNDSFGLDGRIKARDLKRLFLYKPDVAAILYDCMVEEEIVVEDDEDDGFDAILEEDDDGLDDLDINMDDFEAEEGEDPSQQQQQQQEMESLAAGGGNGD